MIVFTKMISSLCNHCALKTTSECRNRLSTSVKCTCCSFKETLLSPYPIGENSLDNKNKQYCCIVL